MNVNEYEDSSEYMVTITNEPTSLQLPPFIRVVVDCERVDNIMKEIFETHNITGYTLKRF